MFLPVHCKHVGHKVIPRPLPEEELEARLAADVAFFSTDFVVVTTEGRDSACVFRLERDENGRTLQRVSRAHCLARWDETAIVEADIEVNDACAMLTVASRSDRRVVVVFGRMYHVSFVDLRTSVDVVHIYDVVPPGPGRLARYAQDARDLLPVTLALHARDLAAEAREDGAGTVLLPCSVAADEVELPGTRVLFFDRCDRKTIEGLSPGDTLAFGCQLGRDILDILGRGDVRTVTFCPHESLDHPQGPFIARCCRTSRTGPVTIDGARGHVLHWGASYEEFVRAVITLDAPPGYP